MGAPLPNALQPCYGCKVAPSDGGAAPSLAVSAGKRKCGDVSPQPSEQMDTDISVLERCVCTSLLENGIEDHQPKASAGERASLEVSFTSQCTENMDNVFLVPVGAHGVSSPSAPTLRSKTWISGSKISMESLILAQDERWRRA